MANEPHITSARIEEADALIPGLPFGGQATVYATTADGEQSLFSYYTDELTFCPGDFVGLTVAEAHQLRFDRDVAYLRS